MKKCKQRDIAKQTKEDEPLHAIGSKIDKNS